VHPCHSWLWKAAVQKKHKVFFWLLIKDKLSTRNILRRKNRVLPSYDCVLCNSAHEETVNHLFLECSFAQSCWALLHLAPPSGDPFDAISSFRDQLNISFMDVQIILGWSILDGLQRLNLQRHSTEFAICLRQLQARICSSYS
jgi:hypothetical protein